MFRMGFCGMRLGAFRPLLGGFRVLLHDTSEVENLCVLPTQPGSLEPASFVTMKLFRQGLQITE
jgi:hypothetical protein